jgi:lipopolysaccharide export LptBFGC system permease protein LptF
MVNVRVSIMCRPTFRIAIAISAALFFMVNTIVADSNQSGNRVWDQSKNMSNESYTWNSFSFAGFYYDLDNNLSTEELTINNIKRTIAQGDISYTTSRSRSALIIRILESIR